jgi:hypothetical protein
MWYASKSVIKRDKLDSFRVKGCCSYTQARVKLCSPSAANLAHTLSAANLFRPSSLASMSPAIWHSVDYRQQARFSLCSLPVFFTLSIQPDSPAIGPQPYSPASGLQPVPLATGFPPVLPLSRQAGFYPQS